MRNMMTAAAAALFVAAGCQTAKVDTAPPPSPTTGSNVMTVGTTMEVELKQTLTTEDNKVGDEFTASVKEPVLDADGSVLVPAGSVVHGEITGLADSNDNEKGQAAIRLNFDRITVNGVDRAFTADIMDVDVDVTDLRHIKDVQRNAGVGAAAGAVLGAVIGGSLKDILIGGVLGAGAGTIVSLGAGEFEAALPEGTDLTLRTTRRVAIG